MEEFGAAERDGGTGGPPQAGDEMGLCLPD